MNSLPRFGLPSITPACDKGQLVGKPGTELEQLCAGLLRAGWADYCIGMACSSAGSECVMWRMTETLAAAARCTLVNNKTSTHSIRGCKMSNLFSRLSGAAIIVLALASNAASADDYPSKPVRLIVPFPPGGSNDVVGRLVAQQLSAQLGQQVFVDNRGSAGGVVGAEIAATSAPDGYTLLVVSIPFAVDPALHKLNYDPIKSFEPIALLATGPDVLVVNPAVPVKSVKELIELAKQKPGQLNYASAGIGTFTHLAGALFTQLAGVNIVHVPYRGGGPAIQDVLAGHVGIMFSSLIQTAPYIKTGQLRPLGTGGSERSPALPDVPTIAEAGVPGYAAANWWGILAPAGTPKPISKKLYDAIQAALKSAELQKAFAHEGATTVAMSSAEFSDYIKNEIAKWGSVVKEDSIRAQ